MNFPEEAPKLPKLPFIAGDLILLATAAVIATRAGSPLGPGPLLAITVCVVGGAALAVIPFLADYARRCDAELKERQDQIAALARTTGDSAEQLGIVASGLNGISESSKHNLESLDKLPARLQERVDSLTQQLAGSVISAHTSAQENVARLEAAAEKITRALAKFESAAQTKTTAVSSAEKDFAASVARAIAQIESLVGAAGSATSQLASFSVPATAVVQPAPAAPTPAEPAVEEPAVVMPEPAAVEAAPDMDPAPAEPAPEPAPSSHADEITPPPFAPSEPAAEEVPLDEPPAPKPPRARKAKPADDIPDLGLMPETSESAESVITSDGFTRLIATAYIGIGNKLFIRGDGPGLSWDKGVPLQFVSIGKWRWETPDATQGFTAKLYKNDQIECTGLGTLSLEPGHQHEVNAGF
jgi:hypothetical protein